MHSLKQCKSSYRCHRHPGDPRYPIDVKAVVEASKEYGTLLEMNNSSLRPDSFRAGGSDIVRDIIKECIKLDMPFIIGSDSHISFEVGKFEYIEKLIEGMEVPKNLIVNTSVEMLKVFGLTLAPFSYCTILRSGMLE